MDLPETDISVITFNVFFLVSSSLRLSVSTSTNSVAPLYLCAVLPFRLNV